jgi:hypothetical protein
MDMTREEVQAIVDERMEFRLRLMVQELFPGLPILQRDNRTLREILEDADRYRWTPPSGSPSSTELLREDRDNDELYR